MRRVAVFAMDAMEVTFAKDLMAQGLMPNLARLQKRGLSTDLYCENPLRSTRAWENAFIDEPDILSNTVFDPDTYTTYFLGGRDKKPLYAELPGLRLIAFDMPYLSMNHDVDGVMVNWGGHEATYPRASVPRGLLSEIDASIGVHPAHRNDYACPWYLPDAVNNLADALVEGCEKRVEIAELLMRKCPDWNLMLFAITETHSAGEMFAHGMAEPPHPLSRSRTARLARERLIDVYKKCDEILGEIIRRLPPDTTIIVSSQHGIRPCTVDGPAMVLAPEFLHRVHFGKAMFQGPPEWLWRLRGRPLMYPPNHLRWQEWMRQRFGRSRMENLIAGVGQKFSRKARRAREKVSTLYVPIPPETGASPKQIGEHALELPWNVGNWYREHWPSMRAFALPGMSDMRLRVNLAGREKYGVVDPGDYEKTCLWLENLFRTCKDPRDGKSIVEHVKFLRMDDPMGQNGPDADIVIITKQGVDAFAHPDYGMIGPVAYRRTGSHTNRGFAVISGPGVKPRRLEPQPAERFPATLRALMGQRKREDGTLLIPGKRDIAA